MDHEIATLNPSSAYAYAYAYALCPMPNAECRMPTWIEWHLSELLYDVGAY